MTTKAKTPTRKARRIAFAVQWVTHLAARRERPGGWVTAQEVVGAIQEQREARGDRFIVKGEMVGRGLAEAVADRQLESEIARGTRFYCVPREAEVDVHAVIATSGTVSPAALQAVIDVVRAGLPGQDPQDGMTLGEIRAALPDSDGRPASRGVILCALVEGVQNGYLVEGVRILQLRSSKDERKVWIVTHRRDDMSETRPRGPRRGAENVPGAVRAGSDLLPVTSEDSAEVTDGGSSERGQALAGILRRSGRLMTERELRDGLRDLTGRVVSRTTIARALERARVAGLVHQAGTTTGGRGRPAKLWAAVAAQGMQERRALGRSLRTAVQMGAR